MANYNEETTDLIEMWLNEAEATNQDSHAMNSEPERERPSSVSEITPHPTVFNCAECNKTFTERKNLLRHQRERHTNKEKLSCPNCYKTFVRSHDLSRHNLTCRGGSSKRINDESHTNSPLPDKKQRSEEDITVAEMTTTPEAMNTEFDGELLGNDSTEIQEGGGEVDEDCALGDIATMVSYSPNKRQKYDLLLTLNGKKKTILKKLEQELRKRRGMKWFLCTKTKMVKSNPEGEEQVSSPHFRSKCNTSTNTTDLEAKYNDAVEKVKSSFLEYQREGSGWRLDEVLKLELGMVTYEPLKGASYIPLPKRIQDKRAVLNIQNKDQKCFLWSVLAKKYHVDGQDQPHRVNHYTRYENELNMKGIEFPVKIDHIPKFEKLNPSISVNVFGYEEQELFPLRITKEKKELHVDLLLYSQDSQRHYCLIRNLARLIDSRTSHGHTMYHCVYCLHGFVRPDLLDDHEPHCSRHGPQKIKMPDEDHATLSFKEVQKQLKVPFIIYADFESILVQCESTPLMENTSGTQKTQHHKPCGFCYTIVSTVEEYNKPPVVYRGRDCADMFLSHLLQEERRISQILKTVVPMVISEDEELEFLIANDCHICGDPLGADRVRDHDHLTGLYRGPSHNECNLNYKFTGKIPVVLHNLRGYDSHLIMQGLGKLKSEKINCIPNNTEKYISFTVGNLVFIDSLQFLNSSLEKLVDNLNKEGEDRFPILARNIDSEKVSLLLRKGVYPYEYMDSFERFEELELPSIVHFYSTLKEDGISDQDYEHAQRVFQAFHCRHMGDYHDLYLMSDVLLLADVFENFRNICFEYYELDPGHFYTSPGLSWSACLKMTGVELQLLTDPDMHLFVEEGLRGGISMITHRFAKANNPYLPSYDPSRNKSFIMYLDANNLYGWAMSQALPVNNFGWLADGEIEELQEDLMTLPTDGTKGYILEVDLEYPQELHDLHNDYPLAPEKLQVPQEWLSPYCTQLLQDLQMKYMSTQKLVPNLNHKENYILHYRNLQFYLSLGMRVTKIHRVLGFDQSPWLKTYIDFNTNKRKHARNDFEKDFFKLMNNSVFGKTMENLRKRVNVKLINNENQMTKLSANPLFDYFRIFSEDLVAVNMKKPSLYLNRPIYVGFCILDLSKILMYDFHYNVIKQNYGNKATLLFTDTDSLCYNIETDDIYQDMFLDQDLYDTSEYPVDHPIYSCRNKKVLGKMKDETHSLPIEEFIGLRPKMYSLMYHEEGREVEKKTAKGIAKYVTKRYIRHSHYRDCLFLKKRTVNSMTQLRSDKHQLYTVKINKIGLSPYDDKRFILENGTSTLAYGHYRIQDV